MGQDDFALPVMQVMKDVNAMLNGGYRVSLEQLVAAYNRLSEIHQRLIAYMHIAYGQLQANRPAAQNAINDVAAVGPEANPALTLLANATNAAYVGQASLYQNLVAVSSRLGDYRLNIWNSIRDYAESDNRVVESMAKINRQLDN